MSMVIFRGWHHE